jgi:hypothetical protein
MCVARIMFCDLRTIKLIKCCLTRHLLICIPDFQFHSDNVKFTQKRTTLLKATVMTIYSWHCIFYLDKNIPLFYPSPKKCHRQERHDFDPCALLGLHCVIIKQSSLSAASLDICQYVSLTFSSILIM